jgi:hypothetical protein
MNATDGLSVGQYTDDDDDDHFSDMVTSHVSKKCQLTMSDN